MKTRLIPATIITILLLVILTVSGQAFNNPQTSKLEIKASQSTEITPDALQKSISLIQNLPEEKKAQIIEKMTQMAQQRRKAILQVQKQKTELRLQRLKLQKAQISQLLAIQKLILEENAQETAKKLENLTVMLEDKQTNEALNDNSLHMERITH